MNNLNISKWLEDFGDEIFQGIKVGKREHLFISTLKQTERKKVQGKTLIIEKWEIEKFLDCNR